MESLQLKIKLIHANHADELPVTRAQGLERKQVGEMFFVGVINYFEAIVKGRCSVSHYAAV